jgi:putative membrane-bound dehydrogenase-like protein
MKEKVALHTPMEKNTLCRIVVGSVLALGAVSFAQAQNQNHGDLKQNALPLQPASGPRMPRVAQGWKVDVVAQPPDLKWPSVVEAAPDGRVFVAEDPMDMPGPGNVAGDRILCIFPDGHITVFADHLYAVFGLRYLDGKLYIHQSPKFTVMNDNDGIGSDAKDIWDSDCLRPWGNGNLNDHIPSNLRVGMDNYLYFSTGDKGMYHAKSNIDGKMIDLKGGGVARIRPDGTDLEIYSNGTRNHLDLAINDEDEIFTYDNTDDGLGWWTRFTHMVDGGYYGYPYDYRPPQSDAAGLAERRQHADQPYKPYTLWRMDEFGGGSPTGGMAYNEDALPPEYHGNAFMCEWGKGTFERFVMARDGGTYKLVEHDQMLAGGSIRPVGCAVTADGLGFYVTDWMEGGWNKRNVTGRLLKLTQAGLVRAGGDGQAL